MTGTYLNINKNNKLVQDDFISFKLKNLSQ